MNNSTSSACSCRPSASLRAILASIFTSNHGRIFGYGDLFILGEKAGQFCRACVAPNVIALQVYHLRQDGVVESVGRGRFRYRVSDDATADFVYAGRPRKVGDGHIDGPEMANAATILFDDGLHPQGVRFFTTSTNDELLQLAVAEVGDDIAIREAYKLRDRLSDDHCDLVTDFRGASVRVRVQLTRGGPPSAKIE